jgi:SAM-dependent methyltransferase
MDRQQRAYKAFDAWLFTHAGTYLWEQEQSWVNNQLSQYLGCSVLQLGGKALIAEPMPNITHFIHAHPYRHPSTLKMQITCSYSKLPFREASFDCILCPHTHEVAGDQSGLLQEVWRVLRPNGYLISFGLRPFGLWHMQQILRSGRHYNWRQNSLGAFGLARLMRRHHFIIEKRRSFAYRPYPYQDSKKLQTPLFLESMGPGFFPYLSNAHLVVAWKQVNPFDPIATDKKIAFTRPGVEV